MAQTASSGPPTALTYVRVSNGERRPAAATPTGSLRVQRAECAAYVAARGWRDGGGYQDVLTGLSVGRRGYQALLAEVRRLRASRCQAVVVVPALDRLGRRMHERVRVREELAALGVPLHSVREGGEVLSLVADILAAVAQEEVRRSAARVAAAQAYGVARGWYGSGGTPLGYRRRPSTAEERAAGAFRSTLAVDLATAPTVREVFRRYARGETMGMIARWAASLPPSARGGRHLTVKWVGHALRSPVYVTRGATGATGAAGAAPVLDRPPGHWPRLIPDRTWRQVEERLGRPGLSAAKGHALLSGFLRCPACGVTGGASVGPEYRCIRCGPKTEPGIYLAARATADRIAASAVGSLLARLSELGPALGVSWRAARRAAAAEAAPERLRAAGHRRAAELARRRLAHAGALLLDGDLDATGYDLVRDACERDLADTRRALAASPGESWRALPRLGEVRARLREWERRLGGGPPPRRSVLVALVEHVEIRRPAFKRYAVTVVWTPLGRALHRAAGIQCPPAGTLAAASR